MAWACRSWNCLPAAGGLEDQEPGKVARMSISLHAYDTVKSYYGTSLGQGHTWAKGRSADDLEIMELLAYG